VEKYGRPAQATDGTVRGRMRFACWMYDVLLCITYTPYFLFYAKVFLNLTEVWLCFFLSCKANARIKLVKTGHGPHSSTLVVICVVLLLFVMFYVFFVCKCVLPPGNNQLQLINKSYNFIY